MKLSQCGIPWEHRFAFYDQVPPIATRSIFRCFKQNDFNSPFVGMFLYWYIFFSFSFFLMHLECQDCGAVI